MMNGSTDSPVSLAGAAKRLMHRLLAIGENRMQLLVVEVQEERDRIVDMVIMAIATAALGMLAALAWSAAVVLLFWQYSPAGTLLVLGFVYCLAAIVICRRLLVLRRHPQPFAATLDQLQKDRACLKRN
jgi:uncharacterized membrane protein YqjE